MKFIFIGGCGRSGSSLLQDLLCRHPEIAGGPEFNFTARIMQLHSNMQKPFYLKRNYGFYTQEELDSRFMEFYRSFFQKVQDEKPQATWISEKTPDNIDVLPELLRLFPESKFLFVLRDGRDSTASFREVYKRADHYFDPREFSIDRLARIWNDALDKRDAAPEAFRSRIHTVRYEALIQDPTKTLNDVLTFLELKPTSTPLHQLEAASGKIHLDNVFYTDQIKRDSLDNKSIGSWRKRLGLWSRFKANLIMAHQLKKEGYEVAGFFVQLNHLLRKGRDH